MITWPIYLFILIELIFVTYLDVKHRKIANTWSLINIGIAVVLFSLFPKAYPVVFGTFQFSIVFILVGFFLFILKIMGGGDSKFLASFFLIVPLDKQDQVFLLLLISTVIIGVIVLVINIFSKWETLVTSLREKNIQGVKSCFGTKFAYAPVILVTWILFGMNLLKKGELILN